MGNYPIPVAEHSGLGQEYAGGARCSILSDRNTAAKSTTPRSNYRPYLRKCSSQRQGILIFIKSWFLCYEQKNRLTLTVNRKLGGRFSIHWLKNNSFFLKVVKTVIKSIQEFIFNRLCSLDTLGQLNYKQFSESCKITLKDPALH